MEAFDLMTSKKVSVIVPVYNAEDKVGRCIKSIIEQEFKNLEIILVNDGSHDNSYEVCTKFQEIDSRIIVHNQKNLGASIARNVGITLSTGEYILFVDSDDFLEEKMVGNLVKTSELENLDLLICGFYKNRYNEHLQLQSSIEVKSSNRIIRGNKKIAEEIIDLFENERINAPWCKLIKAKIIKENNIKMSKDLILQEDLYFNISLLEHVSSLGINEGCYYHYNVGDNDSLTSRYFENKYEMLNKVHNKMLNYFRSRSVNEKLLNRIEYIYVKNVYAAFINLFHKDSHLSNFEKLSYIKKIVAEEKFETMISSAKRTGSKYIFLLLILKTRNSKLILNFSKILSKLKKTYKFNY